MMGDTQNNTFLQHANIDLPILCGAMYPCSNPELVAATSAAGGMGIIQPISLTYVHGYSLREGIRFIRSLTNKPIGMNALIEQSSKRYHQKMVAWVETALEEGVRFFVTSLGKPRWVVERVHAVGGYVYHDVTETKWAKKGLDCGVDGLIAVNNRAGGHAGCYTMAELAENLANFQVPLIAAGGISSNEQCKQALLLGYQGIQMGTRFIASHECTASDAYKQAIVNAVQQDIVLTERITGIPVSVINTAYVKQVGTQVDRLSKLLLRGNKSKQLLRIIYALKSLKQLKGSLFQNTQQAQYWQAGKSVDGIHDIESIASIISHFQKVIK